MIYWVSFRETMKTLLKREASPAPAVDTSKRSFFGIAAGAAVAAPEIAKAAQSGHRMFPIPRGGVLARHVRLPQFRPMNQDEINIMQVLRANLLKRHAEDRARKARMNTPAIRAVAKNLPGLSERISRERSKERVR